MRREFGAGLGAILAAALLAAALSLPARAGVFDDDEARRQLAQLRDQTRADMADLAKRADTLSRNQMDFSNQVEAIKADIAKLRGQVEVLGYELEAAQKRQKDFYVDLDNRLRKLEQPPPAPKAEAPKIDPAQETNDYEVALANVKASKFKEAASAFLAFIKAYPNSSLIASAHYWGGYSQTKAGNHTSATELFGKFVAGWPTDERAPAALESRMTSLEALKDAKGARAALIQIADNYPNSEPGKRARIRLKRK